MNTPIFFESAGDERGTPEKIFADLDREFQFDLDAAASPHNHKCELYYGQGGIENDAIAADWGGLTVFLNPPYSTVGGFVAKAREEADKGATVVMLLPVRSDTKYWHAFIWDKEAHTFRPGVECRFLQGRLTFTLTVPDQIRKWIKSEYASALKSVDANTSQEKVLTEFFRSAAATTGFPRMAIDRILQDVPSEDLLEGAPFPSCVVIFRKAA